MNWQRWCLYVQNLLSTYLFLFQGDNTAARKNCHNDSETNPLFVPLTHIPEEKATHIEGRDTTTKSHLDVVSNLLSDTSSMKSPPESVRLLQSEIQAEIHASAQIRLKSNLYARLTVSTGRLLMLCSLSWWIWAPKKRRLIRLLPSLCNLLCGCPLLSLVANFDVEGM